MIKIEPEGLLKVIYSNKTQEETFGSYIVREWLIPLNITPYELAQKLNIATSTLFEIIAGAKKLTKEIAWKLSAFFQMDKSYFLKRQAEIESMEKLNCYERITKGIIPFDYSSYQ